MLVAFPAAFFPAIAEKEEPMSRSLIRFFLLASVLLPLSAVAQTKTGTAVVTGRVTIGDKPAAGVTVGLLRGEPPTNSGEPQTLAKAMTDAEGRYRLSNLPAGSFRVTALAPGFVSSLDLGPGQPPWQAGRAVTLGEGDTVEQLDFQLTRGGVITGKVFDHDGKTLIGQRVSVWQLKKSPA
jgi:hypothetical protein